MALQSTYIRVVQVVDYKVYEVIIRRVHYPVRSILLVAQSVPWAHTDLITLPLPEPGGMIRGHFHARGAVVDVCGIGNQSVRCSLVASHLAFARYPLPVLKLVTNDHLLSNGLHARTYKLGRIYLVGARC